MVSRKRGAAPQQVDVYHEPSLRPGDWFNGPALVDSPDTTIWVPEGMLARFDAERSLVIEAQA